MSTELRFYVQTVAATGKGVQWAYYSPDLTALWCLSSVATGTTLTSTEWKAVIWTSGTKVTGGTCIVRVGGTRSSRAAMTPVLKWERTAGSSARTTSSDLRSGIRVPPGYSGSAISSGAGSSLVLSSNLSSISWVALSGAHNVPAIVVSH